MTELSGWQNFFVIVGSSAGALIGLQFVVITLVTALPRMPSQQAGGAYATPTIVHFATVLMLSAVLSAPWREIEGPALLWGLAGLGGLVYGIVVTRRMRTHTIYTPVFEDWLFHSLLPVTAYTILAASAACVSRTRVHEAMFGVAAAVLLLLFIGIHNAWDAITYHIFVARPKQENERGSQRQSES